MSFYFQRLGIFYPASKYSYLKPLHSWFPAVMLLPRVRYSFSISQYGVITFLVRRSFWRI